jgi:hypothetical protein
MENDMRGYAIFIVLFALGAVAQEVARGDSNPAKASTSVAAPDGGTPQGYVITPSGTLIFPNAPAPAGDTSTLSGAGPSVSTGPVVGSGPEVSTGPVVGAADTEQEAVQHAETLEALATLREAEALLETGNSDGVDDELRRAEASLSGRTRLDVEAAREALAREDLLPARQYLAAALAERRVRR